MPTALIDGRLLAFEDTGGDGPPIIFSHGWLMDQEMFLPQVTDLRDIYRVITWDAPGPGRSTFDGEPFTYWELVDDLFGLLDHLGIERAVLAGISQGGHVSIRAALHHPDRVRALVLGATSPRAENVDMAARLRQMVQQMADDGTRHAVTSELAEHLIGDPALEPGWVAKWRSLAPRTVAATTEAFIDRDDITERLVELPMPTLMIHGGEDMLTTRVDTETICAGVDDCRGAIMVDGGKHAATMTHPEVVAARLRTFLESLPG